MSERRVFVMKECYICRQPIKQAARGRPRLTCSDACRQARYRFMQGKTSRRSNRIKKQVQHRREMPFIERSFEKRFHEPVVELSYKRWVYECLACGKPYLVERLKSGAKVHPYCSQACEEKSRYHWDRLNEALARNHLYRGRVDEQVWARFEYGKLSPLCPRCGKPFAPNTTLYGKRKRGRPRKYCSDVCRYAAYERRWKTKNGRARVHRFRGCAECGETIDRTDSLGRRRKRFCGDGCKATFKKRAYRARLKMKAEGRLGLRRGVEGRRIAVMGARKNKRNGNSDLTQSSQRKQQEDYATKIGD